MLVYKYACHVLIVGVDVFCLSKVASIHSNAFTKFKRQKIKHKSI